MCQLVLAYDTATNLAVYSHAEAVDELPFPVSALLCSLSSYADQSGWDLQHITLQDSNMCYHRGLSGLLWIAINSNLLLQHRHVGNLLQVADAVVEALLGPDMWTRTASLKQQMKGVAQYLDSLFTPQQQLHTCLPLLPLALPHQTILQPSAAAAAAPKLLQDVCAAADGQVYAAALLLGGRYCCATPSWQSLGRQHLLALQLLATHQYSTLKGDYGQVLLPGIELGVAPAGAAAVQMQWTITQPGLQLCLLSASSYSQQQMTSHLQQVLKSHKHGLAVEPLHLFDPVTAIAVIDAHWATCNSLVPDDTRCLASGHSWWQLAFDLMSSQQQHQAMSLQAGSDTVVALSRNGGTSLTLMRAHGYMSLAEAQVVLQRLLPVEVLTV